MIFGFLFISINMIGNLCKHCWSISDGCHMIFGKCCANKATWVPLPEATSSASPALISVGRWSFRTFSTTSLFLSAAGNFSMLSKWMQIVFFCWWYRKGESNLLNYPSSVNFCPLLVYKPTANLKVYKQKLSNIFVT